MYVNKDKLMVEVQNLPTFSELLARAKEEARQLNQTIDELSRFELDIQFSTKAVKPEDPWQPMPFDPSVPQLGAKDRFEVKEGG